MSPALFAVYTQTRFPNGIPIQLTLRVFEVRIGAPGSSSVEGCMLAFSMYTSTLRVHL